MPDNDDNNPELQDEDWAEPSKSAVKRQMTELQKLGETLCSLADRELAKIPIADDRLMTAVVESRRIRSNSARRRHMQFIGKLMRDIDAEPIRTALASLHNKQRAAATEFHHLESLRDDLLASGLPGIEIVLAQFPQANRQHLRQLVLQHQRETKAGKPPAASRKLFRYLRELQEG